MPNEIEPNSDVRISASNVGPLSMAPYTLVGARCHFDCAGSGWKVKSTNFEVCNELEAYCEARSRTLNVGPLPMASYTLGGGGSLLSARWGHTSWYWGGGGCVHCHLGGAEASRNIHTVSFYRAPILAPVSWVANTLHMGGITKNATNATFLMLLILLLGAYQPVNQSFMMTWTVVLTWWIRVFTRRCQFCLS